MPIVVPPYVQYQAPLFPLRGLWNSVPPEGDRMVSAEIDWGVTTGAGMAVQFQLSGNSPVAFSQIVAMQVDNTSNNSDVQFLFPDSGYTLVVPSYTQLTTPVFTNALQFYVFSPGAVAGDRTLFQAFNSMPPPVAVQQSNAQETAVVTGIPLATNAVVPLIPPSVNGTLEFLSITADNNAIATGICQLTIADGQNNILWAGNISGGSPVVSVINVGPIRAGFVNGLNAVISSTTMTGGLAIVSAYYGIP